MTKLLVAAALSLVASIGAHAAGAQTPASTSQQASPVRFLLGAGLTFGGDNLITVPFRDGSHDNVTAGGLVDLYGGAEYAVMPSLAIQGTIGYHVNQTRAASNGSVRFTRVPIDLLGLYSINDTIRLGLGAEFVSGPELKGSGVASSVNEKFKSTAGLLLEGEYLIGNHMGVKLRYVALKFNPDDSGPKVDGSYGGLMFSYYF